MVPVLVRGVVPDERYLDAAHRIRSGQITREQARAELLALEILADDSEDLELSDDFDESKHPRDEKGRFTHAMSSMPVAKATSKEAKKWRKEHQERYTNDKDFRLVADAAALYAQGSYSELGLESARAVGFDPNPSAKRDHTLPLNAIASPLATYKNYFDGQDLENTTSGSVREGAIALSRAVADSAPLDAPIYRGINIFPHPNAPKTAEYFSSLKSGDEINLPGVTSFTTDHEIADQFALGVAKGQGKGGGTPVLAVTFEIEKGARGLPVAALSPWDQKEIITQGRFKVVGITKNKREMFIKSKGYYVEYDAAHVVLRQDEVYKP
jgi:hypothetical protein